jgi:hypothetical protein
MKHLFNKKILQGGGKSKPKPQPAVLRPPEIGNFQILNSYSVVEMIDLISDGPIEGLVNQNGQVLEDGQSILQGVYLDNTPVQVTNPRFEEYANENKIFHIDIQSGLNKFGDTFYDNNSESYKKYKFPFAGTVAPAILYTAIQSNLLMAKFDDGGSRKSQLYSPLTNSTIGKAGNGWMWVGNPTQSTAIQYFQTLAKDLEVHYTKSSLFAAGTILNDLETGIKNERESSSSNVPQQESITKAQIKLENFKNQYFDPKKNSFDWKSKNDIFFVVKIGSRALKQNAKWDQANNSSAIDPTDSKKLVDVSFYLNNFEKSFPSSSITKIIVPSIITNSPTDSKYNSELFGCVIFKLNNYSSYIEKGAPAYQYFYKINIDNTIPFTNEEIPLTLYKEPESKNFSKANKYNFLNVACEFKDGSEDQIPLEHFKNIFIDYDYNSKLLGPFRNAIAVQRLIDLKTKNTSEPNLSMLLSQAITDGDGSKDERDLVVGKNAKNQPENYSDWNAVNSFDEEAIAITHTIENSNTTSFYVTLAISSLSDTVEIDKRSDWGSSILPDSSKLVRAGSKIPSIVNFKIEYGKINNGQIDDTSKIIKIFSVLALIEGQMLIDLGAPESKINSNLKDAVKEFNSSDSSLKSIEENIVFKLPALQDGEDPTSTKRYVKITKLSAETNSILINKDIYVNKITEIVESNLSYPFSSLLGIKLDARSFSSVPERSYDCRLKKIQIPSNYTPLNPDGSDKRYIEKASDYNSSNQIYAGDWGGEFKEGWTDNPAWIIYDLLTSKRYGLGSYIDESQINKWELYKIARFCDAVDDNGFFVGVSDGVGGLEPRYSCNIVFREQTKIFDAINVVASLFRGIVFFSNSEIHFLDDRPRIPIAIFTNTNVKDGVFNYTNSRRDQQFNTVEVAYLDRFDNYQSKIEYVQDEPDIRKRGIFKTTINTLGVTSRAMARRIGQHIIYQTIKENQGVEFLAGLESLLCRPGDLIILEDELKTRATNYGRVLDINVAEKSLTIDNTFVSAEMNNTITVYTPTGYSTNNELNALADTERSRVDYFYIKFILLIVNSLTGRYYFSGYSEKIINTQHLSGIQYPLYTGKSTSHNQNLYCYYNTGYTGFVLSTGRAFQDNNLYDKVITNTGLSDIFDISVETASYEKTGFIYDTASGNRRGSSGDISASFKFYQNEGYSGPLLSEVENANHPQITRFILSGSTGLDFGSRVYISSGDVNANLVSKIAAGSPYRLERKNASDQIYKIISIREQNQNEYSIVASKYNTGKFAEIENFIAEDFMPATYSTGPITINNVQITELPAPSGITFSGEDLDSDRFSLRASWSGDSRRDGTKVEIYNSVYNEYHEYIANNSSTSYLLTGLQSLGQWKLKLTTLGNNSNYLNSITKETGTFIAYTGALTQMEQPAITNFSIT